MPLAWENKEILCRANRSKSEKDEKENGISYYGLHYGPLSLILVIDGFVKSALAVTPAKAGVQKRLKRLDSRLRGND